MNILKKILDNNAISENIVVTEISGLVRSFEGNIIETDAFPATVGSICEIHCNNNENIIHHNGNEHFNVKNLLNPV